MKQIAVLLAALALTSAAFAQTSTTTTNNPSTGSITNGTASNAVLNVQIGATGASGAGSSTGAGTTDVAYHGSYTVKSAPSIQAAALTASITETCWGSVSGGVSVVGVGVTAAATIKDYDCNRRLNAAVAGRMGRMDIAFNMMCQDDSFRAAAENTDKPCPSNLPVAKQGTEIVPIATSDKQNTAQGNLKQNLAEAPNGQQQYRVADTTQAPATQH